MEIRKYTDIMGVVVIEDIPEGRMVLITANTPGELTGSFGSRLDLPGVKLPDTAAEAALAKYVVTWPVPYQTTPLYIPVPSVDYAFRQGFGTPGWDSLPLTSTTIHLTWPGQKEGITIPSGYLGIAFDRGVFTVPSGAFVYEANVEVVGSYLVVANTNDDGAGEAGKLKYSATATNAIAIVEHYDSSNTRLTFRTLHF
ncbi:MAG TPA: hypothetical protein ENI23_06515 [bacterium]|nr:hypothetical protein [bacterium]